MGYKSPVLSLTLFFLSSRKRTPRWFILGSIPVGLYNQRTSPLLYLRDSVSNHRYLVNTGATISVFPPTSSKPPPNLDLVPAHGRIRSCGERHISLQFGLRRFVWPFHLASVDRPIPSADFLAANNLLIDMARHQLFNRYYYPAFLRFLVPPSTLPNFAIQTNIEYRSLVIR